MLMPFRCASICHSKRHRLILCGICASTRETILVDKFRTTRTLVAYPTTNLTIVIFAIRIHQATIGIDHQLLTTLLEFENRLAEACVTALAIVWSEVWVAIIHTLFPPSKGVNSTCTDALTNFLNATIQIGIFEELLSVLVTEDDTLPRLHLAHPLRNLLTLPPS